MNQDKAEGTQSQLGFQGILAVNTAEIHLKIPMGIPFVIFLTLATIFLLKTAKHPTAWSCVLDFGADDAALLAQGKEDKAKCKHKNC